MYILVLITIFLLLFIVSVDCDIIRNYGFHSSRLLGNSASSKGRHHNRYKYIPMQEIRDDVDRKPPPIKKPSYYRASSMLCIMSAGRIMRTKMEWHGEELEYITDQEPYKTCFMPNDYPKTYNVTNTVGRSYEYTMNFDRGGGAYTIKCDKSGECGDPYELIYYNINDLTSYKLVCLGNYGIDCERRGSIKGMVITTPRFSAVDVSNHYAIYASTFCVDAKYEVKVALEYYTIYAQDNIDSSSVVCYMPNFYTKEYTITLKYVHEYKYRVIFDRRGKPKIVTCHESEVCDEPMIYEITKPISMRMDKLVCLGIGHGSCYELRNTDDLHVVTITFHSEGINY